MQAQGASAPLRRRAWIAGVGALLAGWALPGWPPPVQALQLDAQRLEATMRAQYGERGVQALREWQALLKAQAGQPLAAQLAAVNGFWNRIVLASDDAVLWGQPDYWATPLQTLGRRAGDCEDFVIGKYFSLLHLGVPGEALRFIYVRARIGGVGSAHSVAHMVLGHYATPDAEPQVLDNLTGSISPASARADLTPVFSFNAQGIYVPGARTTPAERISRWPDLLARMREEGFLP